MRRSGSTSTAVAGNSLIRQRVDHRFIRQYSNELVRELIAMLLMMEQVLSHAKLMNMTSFSALFLQGILDHAFFTNLIHLLDI